MHIILDGVIICYYGNTCDNNVFQCTDSNITCYSEYSWKNTIKIKILKIYVYF